MNFINFGHKDRTSRKRYAPSPETVSRITPHFRSKQSHVGTQMKPGVVKGKKNGVCAACKKKKKKV